MKVFAPWKTNCINIGKENWFEEEFTRALNDLDPCATTGLGPLSRYGCDIGTALAYDPIRGYDPERVSILREWTRMRLGDVHNPDPILVFVKPEPHTSKKIEEGRLRIISAVGLVDTMVDRIMFGWLQRAVLAAVGRTPALIGWSPYKGGYRYLTCRYANRRALCIDKSSWDWTVQGWLLRVVKNIIKKMALLVPPWWEEWVDARWEALFRDAVFGFRTGERVQQPGWGVMKSGCYLTILINSLCQAILHALVCRKLGLDPEWDMFKCVGDDTVQPAINRLSEYLECLANLGAIVKEFVVSEELEFCGHRMKGLSLIPAYKEKHLFKILTAGPDLLPLLLQAYQMAYPMDKVTWDWITRNLVEFAPELHRTWSDNLAFVQG